MFVIAALGGASAAHAAPTPVAAVVGDVACPSTGRETASSCRQSRVADAIARSQPNSLWLLGDIQYPAGSLSDFQSSFEKSFGRFRDVWRPVVGNHEYYTPGAAGYFDFFGAAAGPRDRGYYSFNIGRWHVVALNSNCSIVACDAKSGQAAWLRRDLTRHSRMCTAAIWHHPLYSSGSEHGSDPDAKALWRILVARRAEIVLSGHDHDFEVFKRQDSEGGRDRARGLQQFVVGTGGRSAYPFGGKLPNTLERRTNVYGFLKLRLLPRKYSWRFVDEHSNVLDRGVGNCR